MTSSTGTRVADENITAAAASLPALTATTIHVTGSPVLNLARDSPYSVTPFVGLTSQVSLL
jgi:hypothetical protein